MSDIIIRSYQESFMTKVYVKATSLGSCMGGSSDSPASYKKWVINALVDKALSRSSEWTTVNVTLNLVACLLVKNGYFKKMHR